jgi:PDDEXK-like domain of unknown function (DUF3799)
MTLAPGIHDGVTAVDYHNGDSEPVLSASVARVLVNRSPAHAKACHPVLNPELVREEAVKFDIGTAAHKLLLEGEDAISVYLDADEWRTNAAKDFRDATRAAGKIPLLASQAVSVRQMVASARVQVEQHRAQPPLFTDGKAEQTLVWHAENGVLCRARLDWLRDDYSAIDDYKTTTASADPAAWTRTMYGIGADMQVAFYMWGVERLTGVRPRFRYVVQETYQPYALSVVELAPSALAIAEDKLRRALELWEACLKNDTWPAYSLNVASIEVPTWEELRWLERQGDEAT